MRFRPSLFRVALILGALVPAFFLAACGSEDGGGSASNAGGSDASGDGSAGDASVDAPNPDVVPVDGPGACVSGEPCEDGGICAGGSCCEAAMACADHCCDSSEICSFGACVSPGSVCLESDDCQPDEYCEYALGEEGADAGLPEAGADAGLPEAGADDAGTDDADIGDADVDAGACVGGAQQQEGRCLPKPPICTDPDGGVPDGGAINCLQPCEYHPTAPAFDPELKYAWGGMTTSPWESDVMMTPIVVQLDDDDCDGKITASDIPEILFTTHANAAYTSAGPLHAISIVQGQIVEKWTAPNIQPSAQLAGGNIDALPGNEVVACSIDGRVQTFRGDGSVFWTSDPIPCFAPAIADLDSDNVPEIIVEGGILDGATGAIETTFTPAMEGTFLISDLDGDGELDVVSNTQAYHANGGQFVDTGVTGHAHSSAVFKSGPAIADLDGDGKPEVLAIYFNQHAMAVWQYDPTEPTKAKFIRTGIDINGPLSPTLCPDGSAGSKWGGGPVTVADFNGDGTPDVALAGGVGYAVFDGISLMDANVPDLDTFLWIEQTHDCSSSGTGSSLFDFNGDGKAEVIYSDEYYLRIYEGETGTELFKTCNTTHTLNEYPVIADVDNDGQADIVVVSNAHNTNIQCEGTQQSGVRIYGSASGSWVRTRRIWNEHSYHITNVEEDGTIPVHEPDNWMQPGLNDFRLNKQPGNQFAAPDAVVSVVPGCVMSSVSAVVRNLGEAALPPGATVTLYAGTPAGGTALDDAATTVSLYPLQSEVVTFYLTDPPADVISGSTPLYATVGTDSGVHECRPGNNTSEPVSGKCSGPR
jgi:FG-GAP-like repeat